MCREQKKNLKIDAAKRAWSPVSERINQGFGTQILIHQVDGFLAYHTVWLTQRSRSDVHAAPVILCDWEARPLEFPLCGPGNRNRYASVLGQDGGEGQGDSRGDEMRGRPQGMREGKRSPDPLILCARSVSESVSPSQFTLNLSPSFYPYHQFQAFTMYGLDYCKSPLNYFPRAAVVNCHQLNVLKKQNPQIYYLTDLEVGGRKVVH